MGKILIDCGCHNGDLLTQWARIEGDARIIAFEPNFHIGINAPEGSCIYRCVVWDNNETIVFYESPDFPVSSTAIKKKSKLDGDRRKRYYVRAIDFSKFLLSTVQTTDDVHVKMDIEGAEYRVLEHLIEIGTINLINKLYVEWHWKRCGIDSIRHDRLVRNLDKISSLVVMPELYRLIKKGQSI